MHLPVVVWHRLLKIVAWFWYWVLFKSFISAWSWYWVLFWNMHTRLVLEAGIGSFLKAFYTSLVVVLNPRLIFGPFENIHTSLVACVLFVFGNFHTSLVLVLNPRIICDWYKAGNIIPCTETGIKIGTRLVVPQVPTRLVWVQSHQNNRVIRKVTLSSHCLWASFHPPKTPSWSDICEVMKFY